MSNNISTLGNIVSVDGQESIANVTWVVTDGTPGMENQALGLAERLDLPVTVKRIRLRGPWSALAPLSLGRPGAAPDSDPIAPPFPRVAIGVGRQSIPFMAAIKRESRGRTLTVQCQDPRVSARRFDLVVPPEHDSLSGENVFPILGSPNRITLARIDQARERFVGRFALLPTPRLGVLIGGRNKVFRFDETVVTQLADTLRQLSANMGLMVTPSRRTGAENIARIATALEGTGAYIWNGEGENPYLGVLGWADAFLVTADSVNMACEAAATGKPVHIFSLPGGSPKFSSFHHALAARGISRVFEGGIGQWQYQPLDETGRAAHHVQELLSKPL